MSSSSSFSSFNLDTCGDKCGWIAAILAALCYGSFGVPIKWTKQLHLKNSESVNDNDIHPLVLQSYKTFTLFCMSWFVLFFPNVTLMADYTHWGLLSGLLWVLGGTGGIYAIRMAGLAIAVGTWASVMIAVNFIWGILIFQEPVANIPATFGAFCLLACGLVGMSYYSSCATTTTTTTTTTAAEINNHTDSSSQPEGADSTFTTTTPVTSSSTTLLAAGAIHNKYENDGSKNAHYQLMASQPSPSLSEQQQEDTSMIAIRIWPFFGNRILLDISQRTAGICGAIFNGIMTGSSLIPLHYDKEQHNLGGAHYMISFAIGALLSNIVCWIILYINQIIHVYMNNNTKNTSNTTNTTRRHVAAHNNDDGLLRQELPPPLSSNRYGTTTTNTNTDDAAVESQQQQQQPESWTTTTMKARNGNDNSNIWYMAYHNMPRWYFQQLYIPGISAGILLALAMFGSIIAVTQLGQGIGNSVVQCKIIISGVWGIFWFYEIRGMYIILGWFISALASIAGIIWLSQERLFAAANDHET